MKERVKPRDDPPAKVESVIQKVTVKTENKKENRTKKQLINTKKEIFERLAKIFPKNLILFITTHGEVCVRKDVSHRPKLFVIPDNIVSLYKLNLAPPGVSANMTGLDIKDVICAEKAPDFDKALKALQQEKHLISYYNMIMKDRSKIDQLSQTDNQEDLQNFMEELQLNIKEAYIANMPKEHSDFVEERDTLPTSVNLHMWLTPTEDISPEEMIEIEQDMQTQNQYIHFLQTSDSTQNGVQTNRIMVDKRFTTGQPNKNRAACPLNFGIHALNLKGMVYKNILPDIFSSFGLPSKSREKSLALYTSNIFNFISNIKDSNGKPIVERVILIDTSCSNFQDEIPEDKPDLKRRSMYFGYGRKTKKSKTKKNGRRYISKYLPNLPGYE
jgi:hypothetical protein